MQIQEILPLIINEYTSSLVIEEYMLRMVHLRAFYSNVLANNGSWPAGKIFL